MECAKTFTINVTNPTFVWGPPTITGNDFDNTASATFDGYVWDTSLSLAAGDPSGEIRVENFTGTGSYNLPSTDYRIRIIVSKAPSGFSDLYVRVTVSTVNLGVVYIAARGFDDMGGPTAPIINGGTYDFFFTIPDTFGDTLQLGWEALYSNVFGAIPPTTASIDVELSVVP